MRQAGMMAAAGMVALREGPGHIQKDHAHAQMIRDALAPLSGVEILAPTPASNMVLFRLPGMTPGQTIAALQARGVRLTALGPWARAVTHCDVTEAQCRLAAAHIAEVAAGTRG